MGNTEEQQKRHFRNITEGNGGGWDSLVVKGNFRFPSVYEISGAKKIKQERRNKV